MRYSLLLLLFFSSVHVSCQTPDKDQPVLHYLVKEPKTLNSKTPVLILLHGVGSNENDLFSLAPYLPEELLIISARAPFVLGNESFGWYHLDLSTGKPVYNPEEAEKSRLTVLTFIRQIKEKYKLSDSKIILGGFSQGGIISYSAGLTEPAAVNAILVMSGRLLDDVKSKIRVSEDLKKTDIMITHGIYDNVIPVEGARQSKEYLKSIGLNPEYSEYPSHHTIDQKMLADVITWINNVIKSNP